MLLGECLKAPQALGVGIYGSLEKHPPRPQELLWGAGMLLQQSKSHKTEGVESGPVTPLRVDRIQRERIGWSLGAHTQETSALWPAR